jgi:hypothetical protein
VLFGKTFATALRTHMAAHANNRWLFQTHRNTKYTTGRVQQIVKHYAEQAETAQRRGFVSAETRFWALVPPWTAAARGAWRRLDNSGRLT